MRAYWWQAGFHLDPESKQEREALERLGEFFSGLGYLGDRFASGPVGDADDEKSVVVADQRLEVVT